MRNDCTPFAHPSSVVPFRDGLEQHGENAHVQTYTCFNMFLQKNRLVQVLTRGRASFCTSDLGENEARGGSSNEVHCAVVRPSLPPSPRPWQWRCHPQAPPPSASTWSLLHTPSTPSCRHAADTGACADRRRGGQAAPLRAGPRATSAATARRIGCPHGGVGRRRRCRRRQCYRGGGGGRQGSSRGGAPRGD